MTNKFSLSRVISDYIKNKPNFRDDSFWHGSESGKCMRMRFYRRQGIKPAPFDDATLRRFEVGDMFHEWLQKILKTQGVLLSCEELLKDTKLNFSGHYDALIKIGDHLILYDFKTVNSGAFSYFNRDGFPEYDKMQLMSYAYFLRQRFPNLEECRMFYISKDDARVEEFSVWYSQKWEDKILKELNTLNKYWALGELPPRVTEDYHSISCPNAWQCAKKVGKARNDGTYRYKPWCPFLDHCWGKEKAPVNDKVDIFIKR